VIETAYCELRKERVTHEECEKCYNLQYPDGCMFVYDLVWQEAGAP
jgi:hypothetical protein